MSRTHVRCLVMWYLLQKGHLYTRRCSPPAVCRCASARRAAQRFGYGILPEGQGGVMSPRPPSTHTPCASRVRHARPTHARTHDFPPRAHDGARIRKLREDTDMVGAPL